MWPSGNYQKLALLLRAEALTIFIISTAAFFVIGGNWKLFLLLFLIPDITMLGYLLNRKVGAFVYNIGHSYITPAIFGICFYFLQQPELYIYLLIWIAHIGFDRTLGYGLKSPSGFKDTHLGSIGKSKA